MKNKLILTIGAVLAAAVIHANAALTLRTNLVVEPFVVTAQQITTALPALAALPVPVTVTATNQQYINVTIHPDLTSTNAASLQVNARLGPASVSQAVTLSETELTSALTAFGIDRQPSELRGFSIQRGRAGDGAAVLVVQVGLK